MSTRTSHKKLHLDEALQKLKAVLQSTQKKRILVIGDIMLDVYIRGTTDRMSPEAPVVILKETSKETYPGGAANTALNVHELGARTTLVGVIGNDEAGSTLQKHIREAKISSKLVVEKNFQTTTKMRAIGPQGHLIRIDTEATLPISSETETTLIEIIKRLPQQHVVVISDYAKGVMTQNVIATIVAKFGSDCLLVDTKPSYAGRYANIGLCKVNVHEAKELTGIDVVSQQQAERALRVLTEKTHGSVIITRGAKGLAVFDKSTGHISHVPPIRTVAQEVVGAGDTTLAGLALMYAHNHSLSDAAYASNFLAAQAVSRPGTTALSKEEILPLL